MEANEDLEMRLEEKDNHILELQELSEEKEYRHGDENE